jgi:glucose/arabinose dehydrogenase
VPPSNVLLLRADEQSDRAGEVVALLGSLDNPSGLYLDGDWLYIAEEGRILRVAFDGETGSVTGAPEIVVPQLPRGGHWTRTIKKGPDGYLYVTVGSSCNACIEEHPWRAAMIRFKPGGTPELYATGLRNTVGFDWQHGTGNLYGVDNGRDWLGDDFPPERVNRIVQGGFYGWPFFNGDNEPDPDYGADGAHLAGSVIAPAHTLPAHVAPLAITFLRRTRGLEDAALVSQHGSWNRSQKDGYRVVSLHWDEDGSITDRPFLEGFLQRGRVLGRPVDIAEGEDGVIFISDDFNGAIWRVAPVP